MAATTTETSHKPRALIIDDSPEIRVLVGAQLASMGFSVAEASDGAEGLEKLADGTYSIIFLDVLMPLIDGVDVLRQLRRSDKATPVIMLTSVSDAATIHEAHRLGITDYVLKPFTLKEIQAKVEATLRGGPTSEPPGATAVSANESPPSQDPTLPERVRAKLATITTLPSVPVVFLQLESAMADPDCSVRRITEIINNDPATAAGVLRIANSAIYRRSGSEITALPVALTRIGTRMIKSIALSTNIVEQFQSSEAPAFKRREFWRHCMTVGIAAEILAHRASKVSFALDHEVIHLCGLLHDVGKLVLEQHFNAEFHEALAHAKKSKIPLQQAEVEALGTSHGEVGGWLCTRWRLSKQLTDVVRTHHYPAVDDVTPETVMPVLIHVADYFCVLHSFGESGNRYPSLVEASTEALGLDPAIYKKGSPAAREALEAVKTAAEKSPLWAAMR